MGKAVGSGAARKAKTAAEQEKPEPKNPAHKNPLLLQLPKIHFEMSNGRSSCWTPLPQFRFFFFYSTCCDQGTQSLLQQKVRRDKSGRKSQSLCKLRPFRSQKLCTSLRIAVQAWKTELPLRIAVQAWKTELRKTEKYSATQNAKTYQKPSPQTSVHLEQQVELQESRIWFDHCRQ